MLELLVLIARALALACRGHHELVVENVALRQQLRAMKRTMKRPQLRRRDRLFWIVLAHIWRNWRTAVVLVQPDTVVRWHRDWLRRRWTRRSRPQPSGRPIIHHQIRTLVREMAVANPLWGAPRIHGELRILGVDVSERSVSRPWQNPFVGRLIGSIRRECLNHVIIINEAHLRRLLRTYIQDYHRTRTHSGFRKTPPITGRCPDDPPGRSLRSPKSVVSITDMSGGLHKRPCRSLGKSPSLEGAHARSRTRWSSA